MKENNDTMTEILKTTAKNIHLLMLNVAHHIESLEEENKLLNEKIKELEEKLK